MKCCELVSRAKTNCSSLSLLATAAVVVTLGFPEALKHWNNEQIMNFIHVMYKKPENNDEQGGAERELDPLDFLSEGSDRIPISSRPNPLEAFLVVEIAKKAYENLVANGVDVFSRRKNGLTEPSYGSPLAGDAIMIETSQRGLQQTTEETQNGDPGSRDQMPTHQARSFVAPPEANTTTKQEMPDPARKQRIVEWLCLNIQHLNELAQLPFSSRELWRLHQHYFTPVVNECGGVLAQGAGNGMICSVPEVSRMYPASAVIPSAESSSDEHVAVPVSDPALPGSPAVAASLPMLKRKVSYRFLGDAMVTSHSRVEHKMDGALNGSVAKLIEDGHTGHSLPPKTKRARRNRTRISFVPRIKSKLDSYMDVCHEKALITMRQLYFVEQAIRKGQVNPLEPSAHERIHLSGILASEAEMIIVDMI